MEGVARLDDVRLQFIEQGCPAVCGQWQAVVEGAWNGQARDGADVTRLQRRAVTRYQQGVTLLPARLVPGMLRVEIPAHATAGGRIEQGCVDQVHPAHPRDLGALHPAASCLVKARRGTAERVPRPARSPAA